MRTARGRFSMNAVSVIALGLVAPSHSLDRGCAVALSTKSGNCAHDRAAMNTWTGDQAIASVCTCALAERCRDSRWEGGRDANCTERRTLTDEAYDREANSMVV